jgi:hypothetical protein
MGLACPGAGDVQENEMGTYPEDQKQLVELVVRQIEDRWDRNVKVLAPVRNTL